MLNDPSGGYSAPYPSKVVSGAGLRATTSGLALRLALDYSNLPLLTNAPAAGHVLVQDPATGENNRLDLSSLPTTVPQNGSVSNAKFAAAPALTLKGNTTNGLAQPQDVPISALAAQGNPVGDAIASRLAADANLSDIPNKAAARAALNALANDKDAVGAVPAVLDSTTLTAQLRSRFQDPIDLYGFVNANFDGVSTPVDNSDVLSEVLTKAGRKCFMPVGRSYVGAGLPIITNKSVVLHGMGRGEEVVFADGKPGLRIDQGNYTHRTDICGLSFLTLGKGTGDFAIDVKYSDADAVINTNQSRARLQALTLGGFRHQEQNWRGAIRLHNANGAILRDIYSYGRLGTQAEQDAAYAAAAGDARAKAKAALKAKYFMQEVGIVLSVGDTYGLGIFSLHNINVFLADTALQVIGGRSVEGIQGDLFNFVGVRVGVDCLQALDSPGLRLCGGHINCSEIGIQASHMPECFIKDFLVYKIPESVSDMSCVAVGNMPAGFFDVSFIGKNQTAGTDATGKFIGLAITDAPYGSFDIQVERSNIGVILAGSTNTVTGRCLQHGVTGSNPRFTQDTSSGGNVIRGKGFRRDLTNASQITTNLSGAFVLATSWSVVAGERYSVVLHVNHNNNGSAGDAIATLLTSGGNATIAFPNGGGSQADRQPQTSGAASSLKVITEFTVLTTGTLALAALVQAVGGAGFVGANQASMTIRDA